MGRGGAGGLANGSEAQENAAGPLYLDYNATTPIDPQVKKCMESAMEVYGNPSSAHWHGQKAKAIVDSARRSVAQLINCSTDEVFFTSGGTEANNWAIKGAAQALSGRGNHIIVSSIEHPAVLKVVDWLQSPEGGGYDVTRVGVDSEGIVDVEQVVGAVKSTTVLISIMLANNEVGSIQPVQELSQRLKGQAIALHTDASQAVGKIKIDWDALEVDLLTIAGHKLYAPKGVGALIVRRETPLTKLMHGAGQEKGQRAGTESTVLIAGLGKACELARKGLDAHTAQMRETRDRLLQRIKEEMQRSGLSSSLSIRVNGPADPTKRLPNTLSISFEGLDGHRILKILSKDVACSLGSACHDTDPKAGQSSVLEAMGVPPAFAKCTLRLSTGWETSNEDVDRAAAAIVQGVRHAKSILSWVF